MCNFANVFVPGVPPGSFATWKGDGLEVSLSGVAHRDFTARYKGQAGIVACVTGKQCLCGFADWPALYRVARKLRDDHKASWAALFFFWANDRYTLGAERAVDEEETPALEAGSLVVLRAEDPKRKAWRLLLQALEGSVGSDVVVTLHDGRERAGMLEAFDGASQAGTLVLADGQVVPLVAAQVRSVRARG